MVFWWIGCRPVAERAFHRQWTDDTEMACSVYSEVRDRGHIGREALAAVFAESLGDPDRPVDRYLPGPPRITLTP
ncbi:hypothetical protein NLM24_17760 [Nocardia zapadnayensis]|uniref:hypothetical protein n=1 Tax=Nocardia rhamnosiphila TaxID=426716 RepID=UPI0022454CB3|nr:hypothetical protein [Nocardia zapadnayensis]MCX0272515.1 hypothetical protein [Nocardia zapadnayensis]